MSSAGTSGGAGGGSGGVSSPQIYFCYQCNGTVSITPSPTSELICPDCNGGFLEEYESPEPAPNPNPNPFFSDNIPGFPSFSAGFGGVPILISNPAGGGAFELQNPADLSALFGGPARSATLQGPGEFNPFAFLQNYLSTLRAGGANIQFVIENNSLDPGFRVPGNLGDYFIGPGLEQLIQQLAENDPNRYGTPPASKSAVEALANVEITDELLASDSSQCAVCMDTFELGEKTKQMPCKHIYHSGCILAWLELHNSCPVCRYELPTDDPDYENRTRGTPIQVNSSVGSRFSTSVSGNVASEGTPLTPPTAGRRLRISLPWPFSAFSSTAQTSNSGSGNNTGESYSGGQAREEDLD